MSTEIQTPQKPAGSAPAAAAAAPPAPDPQKSITAPPAAQGSTEAAAGAKKDPESQAAPPAAAPAKPEAGKETPAKPEPPKAEGQQAGETKPPEQAPPAAEVVYDLKLPDGSKLTAAHVDEWKATAKELKLTPEQAQKLLDRQHQAAAAQAQTAVQELAQKRQGWQAAVLAHPTFGGANAARTAEMAKRGRERFDRDGALGKLLDATGLGDLPEAVYYFAAVGEACRDDSFVVPPAQPAPKLSDADVFYGKNGGLQQ